MRAAGFEVLAPSPDAPPVFEGRLAEASPAFGPRSWSRSARSSTGIDRHVIDAYRGTAGRGRGIAPTR